jgi:integrase
MACIRKRRDKYVVDYRDAAGIRRWVTCETRKEADGVLADKIKASGEHEAPAVDPNIRVAEYAERWIRLIIPTVKQRSAENYAATLRRYVLPAFGTLKIVQLHRGRIRLFLAGKLTALKPGSVRLIYAVLRLILGSAVDDGILQANPADGLGKTFRFHKKAAAQHEEIKAMTRQQLAHFLQTAERVAVEYWVFFFLLARTGLRLGEALALQWEDLDFAALTIRVQRGFSNDRLESTPKGNRSRTVDMSRQLSHVLRRCEVERKAETLRKGWPHVPVWVFCDAAGEPIKEQRIERWFKRAVKTAGLPLHFTPHCLRHTYSSLLLSGGVNPIYVQRQLGHASIKLTVDLYGKWLPMEHKAAVDRLDDPAEDGGGEASGSKMVATAVAGAASSARIKGDSVTSGPTGPGWAPLSRTTPR